MERAHLNRRTAFLWADPAPVVISLCCAAIAAVLQILAPIPWLKLIRAEHKSGLSIQTGRFHAVYL